MLDKPSYIQYSIYIQTHFNLSIYLLLFLFLKASVRSRVFALALHCGFPWGSAAGLWFLMKK